MKLIGIVIVLAAVTLALPAAALEGTPDCGAGPVSPETVQLLHDKLSASSAADAEPVPDAFYEQLACYFKDAGQGAPELEGLSADEILQRAIDQQDLTRSRADALLAILKAMRQAREDISLQTQVK